jgi:hypothetical protein
MSLATIGEIELSHVVGGSPQKRGTLNLDLNQYSYVENGRGAYLWFPHGINTTPACRSALKDLSTTLGNALVTADSRYNEVKDAMGAAHRACRR